MGGKPFWYAYYLRRKAGGPLTNIFRIQNPRVKHSHLYWGETDNITIEKDPFTGKFSRGFFFANYWHAWAYREQLRAKCQKK